MITNLQVNAEKSQDEETGSNKEVVLQTNLKNTVGRKCDQQESFQANSRDKEAYTYN